jgi:hypothetical protein
LVHRPVPVKSYEEGIAKVPSGFQVNHVAWVKQVEASVGDDQAFAGCTQPGAPVRQCIPGNDLLAKIHASIFGERHLR